MVAKEASIWDMQFWDFDKRTIWPSFCAVCRLICVEGSLSRKENLHRAKNMQKQRYYDSGKKHAVLQKFYLNIVKSKCRNEVSILHRFSHNQTKIRILKYYNLIIIFAQWLLTNFRKILRVYQLQYKYSVRKPQRHSNWAISIWDKYSII